VSKHVLLTGFAPFGDYRVNPSELLVRSFEGRTAGGRRISVLILPYETRSLRDRLAAALAEARPEIVIGTDFAPGRHALALERLGINVLDFAAPDAVGTMRKNDTIARGGPDARSSTLPLEPILEAWNTNGVPGYISNSAGTGLGNQWLYEMLALTANSAPPVPVGFVHVPALPAQAIDLGAAHTPSMALDLTKKGMETLIEAVGVWIENTKRPVAPTPGRPATGQMWIPRGIREVER
jgi:pyroglutamyl-peptidase